jgi:predicted metal-binding protein
VTATAVLHICLTCRAGQSLADDEERPGQTLYNEVAAIPASPTVELRAVTCLAVCEQGCGATLSAPGKFGYLLGRLDPSLAADLLAYAQSYAAHPTGAVMPSRRAASLKHVILGRIPALDQIF